MRKLRCCTERRRVRHERTNGDRPREAKRHARTAVLVVSDEGAQVDAPTVMSLRAGDPVGNERIDRPGIGLGKSGMAPPIAKMLIAIGKGHPENGIEGVIYNLSEHADGQSDSIGQRLGQC